MLKLHIPTFLFVIINMLILYWVLKKLLFKPVTEFMENRTNSIKLSLDNAEKDKTEASELKQKYETQLKAGREEADKIISDARVRGDSEYSSIISSARQDAENILTRAREEIEHERSQMLKEVRNEVASLALAAASKILEANMNTEANRTIVDKFIDEAGAA